MPELTSVATYRSSSWSEAAAVLLGLRLQQPSLVRGRCSPPRSEAAAVHPGPRLLRSSLV